MGFLSFNRKMFAVFPSPFFSFPPTLVLSSQRMRSASHPISHAFSLERPLCLLHTSKRSSAFPELFLNPSSPSKMVSNKAGEISGPVVKNIFSSYKSLFHSQHPCDVGTLRDSSKEYLMPSSDAACVSHTHDAHIHTCRQSAHIYEINKSKRKRWERSSKFQHPLWVTPFFLNSHVLCKFKKFKHLLSF